jgi:hypothetical protein
MLMLGSAGETMVVRFDAGGYWALESGRRDESKTSVRRYMAGQSSFILKGRNGI